MTDVTSLTSRDLLSLYTGVMVELRRRGIVRTANNPVADLGERLFCDAMGWFREHHQGVNYDATTVDGARVQIKARRLTREKVSLRSGTIYDKDGFDLIAIVLFSADFGIERAVVVPREVAFQHLRWSSRQKGWYVGLTRRFWAEPRLIDVTEKLIRQSSSLLMPMN